MRQRLTADRLARLLDLLRAAAERGERCPSNAMLGQELGLSRSHACDLLATAERAGHLRVYRAPRCAHSRVVEAVDGSWRTAGTIPAQAAATADIASPDALPAAVAAAQPVQPPGAPILLVSGSRAAFRTAAAPPVVRPTPPAPVFHRHCQFPLGDPDASGFRLCEAPTEGRPPYCPTHRAICFVAARDAAGDTHPEAA